MGHLREHLVRQRQGRHFAVVDGAVLDGLLTPLYALGRNRFTCLLAGGADPDVAHVAPYLVELDPEAAVLDFLETRAALPWGYFLASALPLRQLHLHLRPYSVARGPAGEELVFRFWDPRVLRSMGAIFSSSQSEAFMQGVDAIYLTAADGFERVDWDDSCGRLRFSRAGEREEEGVRHHAGV